MFKIPTYDDVEKNEIEFNEKRKEYQSGLFQKRKILNEDDDEKLKVSKSQKTSSTSLNNNLTASNNSKPAQTTTINECCSANDDEDDLLLSEFIAQNKDFDEKKSGPSAATITNNQFKIPQVPEKTTSIYIKKTIPTNSTATKQPQVTSSGTIVGGGSSGSGGPMVVNSKQRGNPVLKHIRNVQWNFSDSLTPDYCMTRSSCALFLTMKYHLLNPTYIHQRIKELGRAYDLRVMLVLCDVKEPQHCIKELEKICIFSNFTMILCWSNEEIGRYLETYKAYEFKSAESIMEKSTNSLAQTNSNYNDKYKDSNNNSDANFINSFTDFMCQIKSVNKTDASTLRQTFGSIRNLSKATRDEINLCPGLGSLKVKRIYDIFRTPFQMKKI